MTPEERLELQREAVSAAGSAFRAKVAGTPLDGTVGFVVIASGVTPSEPGVSVSVGSNMPDNTWIDLAEYAIGRVRSKGLVLNPIW